MCYQTHESFSLCMKVYIKNFRQVIPDLKYSASLYQDILGYFVTGRWGGSVKQPFTYYSMHGEQIPTCTSKAHGIILGGSGALPQEKLFFLFSTFTFNQVLQ